MVEGEKPPTDRKQQRYQQLEADRPDIEAIARCILPDILAFYESEEGQREFAEWQAQQMKGAMQRGQMKKQHENSENGASPTNGDAPFFTYGCL